MKDILLKMKSLFAGKWPGAGIPCTGLWRVNGDTGCHSDWIEKKKPPRLVSGFSKNGFLFLQ
ncbi:MAG: hypothetical protein ABIY90_10565 [Puia sp.]